MLAILRVLKLKLILYKKIKKINYPIIYVYSVCWNEEKILPFYLNHYSQLATKIIIFDNESTDNTIKILKGNLKVKINTYKTDNKNDAITKTELLETCWKQSRGKVDWVILVDMDEFVYPTEGNNILKILNNTDKTIFRPVGFNMISEKFPSISNPLLMQTRGFRDDLYSKQVIFDPHYIVKIKYAWGCHTVMNVIGKTVYGTNEFRLLHFKNLSLEYVLNRCHLLHARRSERAKRVNASYHYGYSDKRITDDFYEMLGKSVPLCE